MFSSVHSFIAIEDFDSELDYVLILLDILLAGPFMVPSIVEAIEFVRIDENSTEDALGLISLFRHKVLKSDFLDTWDIWDGECLLHCLVKFTVRDPKIV